MNIDTPLIRNLTAHLLGLSRQSIPPQHGARTAAQESPEEAAVMERFHPFAELFFLVASADGEIDKQERAVMLGAFRALTGGRVRASRLEALEDELRDLALSEGHLARLEAVCSSLAGERDDAELAFTLACAVALANEDFDPGEESLLSNLAAWLRISPQRIAALMDLGRNSLQPSA